MAFGLQERRTTPGVGNGRLKSKEGNDIFRIRVLPHSYEKRGRKQKGKEERP